MRNVSTCISWITCECTTWYKNPAGGGGALPYVGGYQVPVNRPPFLYFFCSLWCLFHLNLYHACMRLCYWAVLKKHGKQWHNRGGRVPPRLGNFCWPTRKKEARKKWRRGKMDKKRRKIVKGKVENWKWKEEKDPKWGEDLFYSPFFLFFCFLFFVFFAFHFSKWLKFVLSVPKWKFSTSKKHFTPGKNQEKWLCPLRRIFLLCPWCGKQWYTQFVPKQCRGTSSTIIPFHMWLNKTAAAALACTQWSKKGDSPLKLPWSS